jgi:hypothetical protein
MVCNHCQPWHVIQASPINTNTQAPQWRVRVLAITTTLQSLTNTSGQKQPRNAEISPAILEHEHPEEPALETVETANTLAGLQHSEASFAVPASISSQAKVHPSFPNRLRILASGWMLILVFLSGFRPLSTAVL